MSGRKRLLPVLVAAALLTACGSTVQVHGSAVVGGGNGLGSATGGNGLGGTSAGTTTAGSTGGSTGGVGGPQTTGGLGTTGSTTGGVGGTGDGGGFSVPTTGAGLPPGVTATSVKVGFVYDKNAGAVNAAVGIGSITSGDSRANTNAVIKDINAHGGLGGRKVVPVWANFDSTSAQTLDQQDSAVCQAFTQDDHVYAVVEALREAYRQCLSKAGVVMLDDGLPGSGEAELRRNPTFIEQGYPNVDRLARFYLTPLVGQKYFTPWDTVNARPAPTGVVKVGILTLDDTVFAKAVDTYLVPALKRMGYTPVVEKISPLQRASDASSQAAAVQAAQLTFAANGVTHVIPFESNGNLSTFFLPTARSQGYYPRYGVYTGSGYEALLESGIVDAKQMNGAVGFGWVPAIDLNAADNPPTGPYSNANRRHCLAVMKASGITFDSGNAEAIALNTCSSLYLLKATFDRRPAAVAPSDFIATLQSLGTTYQKAGGVGEDFRPGRQDPPNKAYDWRFTPACSCFRYSGAILTIP